MYITREAESIVDALLSQGKVVLVTGARQVGKTTMLREHLGERFNYVTLENPVALAQARSDALLFFDEHQLPLIIDEIQRVPELFSTVKYLVDELPDRGQIVLTGSQTYQLMRGVSESLAGRVRILEMAGLSLREVARESKAPHPYVPERFGGGTCDALSGEELWRHIHRGSMPELQDPAIDWDGFYGDYVRAYLERDVRDLINVRDEAQFYSFLVACAARSGQILNLSDIGETVGVDHKTARAWLSVLQASGVVRLIEPFWPNVEKRLSKRPKLYFMDTGLVCHLTRWTTPEQLRLGAAAGYVFETFVVSEVLKSYINAGKSPRDVWFYRDSRKREIDLVIQEGHVLHPVEIKMGAQVGDDALRHFSALEGFSGYEVGFGHVICQTKEPYLIQGDVQAVPVWAV